MTSERVLDFLRSPVTVAGVFSSEYLPFKKSFIKCIENFQLLALGQNSIELLGICAGNASGKGLSISLSHTWCRSKPREDRKAWPMSLGDHSLLLLTSHVSAGEH